MAKLVLENVTKIYDRKIIAVKDIDFLIEDKEFLVLVGPSGCGKSTILRMIAGLEEISSGNIYMDENRINEVDAKDRDIAMVFQNYALYPHMTVYENMAFGLKMRKMPKSKINRKVLESARILGIEDLMKRKPRQLSGGQRQRVALGRAIVRNPQVFLLDEPLSNLDAQLRGQMRAEIYRLYKKLNTTIVYVTHDQTEAMTMGSRIVVLKDGMIQQADVPEKIYHCPANTFVAGFIGTPPMNLIDAEIIDRDGEMILCLSQGSLVLPTVLKERLLSVKYAKEEVILGIRCEDISLFQGNKTMEPILGVVSMVENLGAELNVHFHTASGNLVAKASAGTDLQIDQTIKLYFNVDKIHLFDKNSGNRLI